MTVVLDTHVLIWHASESEKLSENARRTIESSDYCLVSAISAWEIGMLVSKGRLSLNHDVSKWIKIAGTLPKIQWVPVDTELAFASTCLPGDFHGDPADRIITATALSVGATLITADQRIQRYRHVQTVW